MVKAEIKEEPLDLDDLNDQDLESDPEEEECYRIIEETVVDVSTLPGRIFFENTYILLDNYAIICRL